MAFDDDKYFDLIESEVQNVYVAHNEVPDEIQKNFNKNLRSEDDSREQTIENIISQRVRSKYICWDDTAECQKFLAKVTSYPKRNGEFFSTALALYLSRMGGDEICEQLFGVHLVTDDLGVVDDFGEFFQVNQIGNIIDSIDVVTLLYLRERITKQDLDGFCISLKSLYSRTLAELEDLLENIRMNESDVQIISLLSEIMNLVQYDDGKTFDQKWSNFRRSKGKIYKRAKQKYSNFFDHLEAYIADNSSRQLTRIEERRKQIENVWKL